MPSPQLQALVDRRRPAAGQPSSACRGSYHFAVLDLPIANAHAMSNYVFVTRGLLASLEDEAELAAALGHELGHLAQHHAAQRARARQGVLDAAVEAAVVTGSVTVGRSVARDGLLALRRYSREQELEADRLGLSLLVRAGYRGAAMASLIEKLRRESQFELQLMGEAPNLVDRRSATSTHPAPVERLTALEDLPEAQAPGATNRAAYLAAINGMSVDDAPPGRLRAGQQVPASLAQASVSRRRATSVCSTTRTACWAWAVTIRCCSSPAPRSPCRAALPSGCATS